MFEIAGGIILAALTLYVGLPLALVTVVGLISLSLTVIKKVLNV